MTIKIPKTGVTPLAAIQWYITTLLDEMPLFDKRMSKVRNFPPEKVEREKRNAVDRCIRAQYYLGWNKFTIGHFYREEKYHKDIELCVTGNCSSHNKKIVSSKLTNEHVIPVAVLRDSILKQDVIDINHVAKAILSPVALISKDSVKKIKEISTTEDSKYPFKRYSKYGITVVTHEGKVVTEDWSMGDHWKLLKRESQFSEIFDNYDIF